MGNKPRLPVEGQHIGSTFYQLLSQDPSGTAELEHPLPLDLTGEPQDRWSVIASIHRVLHRYAGIRVSLVAIDGFHGHRSNLASSAPVYGPCCSWKRSWRWGCCWGSIQGGGVDWGMPVGVKVMVQVPVS